MNRRCACALRGALCALRLPAQVWECKLDYEAFRADKDSDAYDIPRQRDGSVLPWCFGRYQHAYPRLSLQ